MGAEVSGSALFSWEPTDYARGYDVEVYKNGDTTAQTTNKVASAASWKQTTWTPSTPLPQATDYVWRVRRVDADNRKSDTQWSAWRSFDVTGDSPTLQDVSSVPPMDGQFDWSMPAGAAVKNFRFSATRTSGPRRAAGPRPSPRSTRSPSTSHP